VGRTGTTLSGSPIHKSRRGSPTEAFALASSGLRTNPGDPPLAPSGCGAGRTGPPDVDSASD